MKKSFSLLVFLLIVVFHADGQTPDSKIAPELRTAFEKDARQDFIVLFHEKAQLAEARSLKGKSAKGKFVFETLQEVARRSQGRAVNLIRQTDAGVNSLFLVNALAVQGADYATAYALATLPEVKALASDPWVKFPTPVADVQGATSRSGTEWGIDKINAPAVWNLGFLGQGVTIGGADTGYDWEHPAVTQQYRGRLGITGMVDHNYNWHDAIHDQSPLNSDPNNPCGFNVDHPCDDGIHGTHTMGTMAGDDGQGNQIGVAPGAFWVGCRNMERGWGRPSSYIECFQWFLAPTDLNGGTPDPERAPDVINNSWYCSEEEGCNSMAVNEMMRDAVIALKASGVFVVVSNGNFGPNCSTSDHPPAYFPESFSIGATRDDDGIAGFSSRGPVTIDSSYRLKPEVVAPGASVRSSIPGNDYAFLSGTSMAGPHVAGLVALVISSRPELAGEVETLEQIIKETAVPLLDPDACVNPTTTPNSTYGHGRVDALAAVQRAMSVSAPTLNITAPMEVFPNPATSEVYFQCRQINGQGHLRLLNANGVSVYEATGQESGSLFLRVPLTNLPNGVYFWQMTDNKAMKSGKLVKD